MKIRKAIVFIACAALLCGCGGEQKKVDGGYFGDVPSLLISQATDKAEMQQRFKTEMESEDDVVKLQSEANRKEEEYEAKLKEAYDGLKDISVRYAVENSAYTMEQLPVMSVERFSSESAQATVKFTLKTSGEVPNEQMGYSQFSHTIYCKFVDKDGNVVCKKTWYTVGKMDGQTLGATLTAGTTIPCEVSFNFGADKEEADGKTTFTVPESAIDKMVVITKDEYEATK